MIKNLEKGNIIRDIVFLNLSEIQKNHPNVQIYEQLRDMPRTDRNIVWINYVPGDGGKEQIYEIDSHLTEYKDNINQVLVEIKRANNTDHVNCVDTNTTRLIETIIDIKLKLSSKMFSISPMVWLKDNVKTPSQITQYQYLMPSII